MSQMWETLMGLLKLFKPLDIAELVAMSLLVGAIIGAATIFVPGAIESVMTEWGAATLAPLAELAK